MAVKETAQGTAAHTESMELFVLTLAQVAGECPAWIVNQETTMIHGRNKTSAIFTPLQIKLLPADFNRDIFRT